MKQRVQKRSKSDLALIAKMMAGFKYISGDEWKKRANYQHLWPLVQHLFVLGRGAGSAIPASLVPSLAFMLGAHAGRVRKGIRKRPYFHHILMGMFVQMLAGGDDADLAIMIHHDDVEDLPENFPGDFTRQDIVNMLLRFDGTSPKEKFIRGIEDAVNFWDRLVSVSSDKIPSDAAVALANPDHTTKENKHQVQRDKFISYPLYLKVAKLCDRLTNLYDMRQDKPKGFTPTRIHKEILQALELANMLRLESPNHPLLVLLDYVIELLATENGLQLA